MARRWSGFLVAAVLVCNTAAAAPLEPKQIPAPLAPWVPWVLRGHEQESCPVVGDDDAICAWAGRLTLTLDGRGGKFSQDWEVVARTTVSLPGDEGHWPLDVKADGKPIAVVADEGAPTVELLPGRHSIAGAFQWAHLPESLPVPSEVALVALSVNGRRIDWVSRDDDGDVFLQKEAAPAENDSLQISVHRKLDDGVPVLLTTRVTLEVAGKARELTLGKALPAGFAPHQLDSPLPARLEPDGRLRLQARPGSWVITLVARHDGPLTAVTRPAPEGPWKDGEEIWVFQAAPAVRVASVEGVPTVDPQQTTLPGEWRALPAYLLAPGATLKLAESRRGDANPAPDQLSLERELWLNFDGGGLTAHDRISGTFHRSWRLSMGPAEKLGRVAVGGADQFITRHDGREGVEIRQGQAEIGAESRIAGVPRTLSVVGWDHDFQSMSATLNLPPGWHLVHASGADSVSESWLRGWTLLELFLVLICAVATGKLFGPRAGALMLLGLGLTVTEPDAPQWIWLVVLVAEALARALGETRAGRVLRLARLGTWIALVLIAVPFAIDHLRSGLFPAQEPHAIERYAELAESKPQHYKANAPVPASEPPPAEMERLMDKSDSAAGGLESAAPAVSRLTRMRKPTPFAERGQYADKRAQNLSSYDPSVVVQTGPGLPRWSWRQVTFGWNGPVEKDQPLTLWLISPAMGAVLALLRVALLALLILLFVRRWRAMFGRWLPPAALALVLLARPASAAEFPPGDLLDQLRAGLLEKPECSPHCATIGRLALEAASDRLRLRLEISAAAPGTVPLPGHTKHWVPAEITVDGKAGPQLYRDDEGGLYLRVAAGSHQVVMDGPLPARDVVQIPLPQKPHLVSAQLHGWKLDGVGDDGEIADSLQLTREERGPRATASAALAATSLPPFVSVERTLQLGLKWQVSTRVTRLTPIGSAVLLEVPLLPGESPISEGLRVAGGKVQLTMAADAAETTWVSTLEQKPSIALVAARAPSFVEVWSLEAAPIWHTEVAGIPPVLGDGSDRVPRWRPWPGETVTITVTRPGGTDGQTLTIEHVELNVRPGARSTLTSLSAELHASRGGQHVITLPPDAVLESLTIDGAPQPLRSDGGRVTLPLKPTRQTIAATYREPTGLGLVFRPSPPDLGARAVNVSTDVSMPDDRWVLLVGGPRLGPSVLFWSTAIVLVLVALGLGRLTLTPLRARHWALLGLGLSQMPVPAIAIVAGWFVVLGLRRHSPEWRPRWFDLRQLTLVIWTLVAAGILFVAVEEGLLSHPDMHIEGNGSGRELLRWFADRTASTPPAPWVLSVPLLVYRIAMLAWALWLALSVIHWSRWAWRCFSEGGLWQRLRRPVVTTSENPPA